MSHGDGQGCAKDVNAAVAIFNKNLKDLVNDFNKKVKGAKFTYVDIFSGGDPLAFGRLGINYQDSLHVYPIYIYTNIRIINIHIVSSTCSIYSYQAGVLRNNTSD